MKFFRFGLNLLTSTLLILILDGCASVRHTSLEDILIGESYPINIDLKIDDDEHAEGVVYYRTSKNPVLLMEPLRIEGRGQRLSFEIPSANLQQGDWIEYYLEIKKGDKFINKGSNSNMYHVDILTMQERIAKRLHSEVNAQFSGQPITFVLHGKGLNITSAEVIYQRPISRNFGSWRRQHTEVLVEERSPLRMQRDSFGITLPGSMVRSGVWNYRIEAQVEGEFYRLPKEGWYSFDVRRLPVPETAANGSASANEEYKQNYRKNYESGVAFYRNYNGRPFSRQEAEDIVAAQLEETPFNLNGPGTREGMRDGLSGQSKRF
jgi:hypothetical protein